MKPSRLSFGLVIVWVFLFSPSRAFAECPKLSLGSTVETLRTGKTYSVSWENSPFVKCVPYSHLAPGHTHLRRLGDPAWSCGGKIFNQDFARVFTKDGEKFKTLRIAIGDPKHSCISDGDIYRELGAIEMLFSIEHSARRFTLREDIAIVRKISKIVF